MGSTTRVDEMPDWFAGRVHPNDLPRLREYRDVGEPEEMLSLLVSSLYTTDAGITPSERGTLTSALHEHDMTGEREQTLAVLGEVRVKPF